MFKYKSKLMVSVMLIFVITVFMSCEKTIYESDVTIPNIEKSKPIDDFTVIFKNGKIVSNDEGFINSNPRIANALFAINTCRYRSTTSETDSLTINQDGVVISNNEYYNGKLFVELLINDGGMSYFDQNFTAVFNKNGYKSISNQDVYLKYPNLKDDLIELGYGIVNKIHNNEEVALSFVGNKFYLNGNEINIFTELRSTRANDKDRYQEFKDCVGHYWYLPLVNVVACGVEVVIADYQTNIFYLFICIYVILSILSSYSCYKIGKKNGLSSAFLWAIIAWIIPIIPYLYLKYRYKGR